MINETKIEIFEAMNELMDEIPNPERFVLIDEIMQIDNQKEMIRQSQILIKTYIKWHNCT